MHSAGYWPKTWSRCSMPAHDNPAMDGYACAQWTWLRKATAACRGGQRLRRGALPDSRRQGQAVRIMTGAVLPRRGLHRRAGACAAEGAGVIIPPGQRLGQNIRRAGEDLAQGAVALPRQATRRGRTGPDRIARHCRGQGLSQAQGRVLLHRGRDRLDRQPPPGQIYDSNRYILFWVLRQLDCELLDMGVIPDQPAALEGALLDAAASADVIPTSGGSRSARPTSSRRCCSSSATSRSGRSTSSQAARWPSARSAIPCCSACPAIRSP